MKEPKARCHELTLEDRLLWNAVTRQLRPLASNPVASNPVAASCEQTIDDHSGRVMQCITNKKEQLKGSDKTILILSQQGSISQSSQKQNTMRGSQRFMQSLVPESYSLHPFHLIELRKIKQQQIKLERRLDLHGLTEQAAYARLLAFLQSAQQCGLRYVLVITGKGKESYGESVLRRHVPHWLASRPFAVYLHSFEYAADLHGGNGALYIKVRDLIKLK